MKVIYDLIQRFEVEDGIPRLVSSNIQVIEGGEDLLSIAQEWIEHNTVLRATNTSQYIGYKKIDSKRYWVILSKRSQHLLISFPNYIQVEVETEPDTLFPYTQRATVTTETEILAILEKVFA